MEKIRNVDKKILNTNSLEATAVLNTKISKVENKGPDTSSLVSTTVFNTIFSEVEDKTLNHAK